jgi:hypothetical protein
MRFTFYCNAGRCKYRATWHLHPCGLGPNKKAAD